MVQRVAIRIDVGPAVPLDLVSTLIQNVSTVCNTAVALDRQSELNRATRLLPLDDPARIELIEYLQTRRYRPYDSPDDKLYGLRSGRIQDILERLFLSGVAFGPPNLWPPAEAQASYLLGALRDSEPLVPTVESISYTNPLEIIVTGFTWGHLVASGGSLLALLNFAAFVGPRREKMQAEAKKTTAEAGKVAAEAHQIRTESECRAELFRALLSRVQEGAATLTPAQINEIVDDEAIRAILALTQRPLEIENQSDGDTG